MTPYGYPADAYHCLLDEQPHYLVPQRLLLTEDPAGDLIVNPNCWFSWHGPLPPDKAVRMAFSENLHPGEWMVWVDDPATGAIWPFWLGTDFAACFHDLSPGEALTQELPAIVRWTLWQAGVLVRPNHTARRRAEWLDSLWKLAPAFERGYTAAPGLIHPFHIGALRRYYRAKTRTGAFALGDNQVDQRYYSHNEGVAQYFHHQLTNAVSGIARRVVKPSYAYCIAYQSGSELETHTDREQCEYSVTLCFDASPEPDAQAPWPLQLDTADGRLKIWQYLGDSLVYRGRFIPHSRERLPHGHTSSSLLFHYVDEAFDGPLW